MKSALLFALLQWLRIMAAWLALSLVRIFFHNPPWAEYLMWPLVAVWGWAYGRRFARRGEE